MTNIYKTINEEHKGKPQDIKVNNKLPKNLRPDMVKQKEPTKKSSLIPWVVGITVLVVAGVGIYLLCFKGETAKEIKEREDAVKAAEAAKAKKAAADLQSQGHQTNQGGPDVLELAGAKPGVVALGWGDNQGENKDADGIRVTGSPVTNTDGGPVTNTDGGPTSAQEAQDLAAALLASQTGQTNTPVGNTNTPVGQTNTPVGQTNTPVGAVRKDIPLLLKTPLVFRQTNNIAAAEAHVEELNRAVRAMEVELVAYNISMNEDLENKRRPMDEANKNFLMATGEIVHLQNEKNDVKRLLAIKEANEKFEALSRRQAAVQAQIDLDQRLALADPFTDAMGTPSPQKMQLVQAETDLQTATRNQSLLTGSVESEKTKVVIEKSLTEHQIAELTKKMKELTQVNKSDVIRRMALQTEISMMNGLNPTGPMVDRISEAERNKKDAQAALTTQERRWNLMEAASDQATTSVHEVENQQQLSRINVGVLEAQVADDTRVRTRIADEYAALDLEATRLLDDGARHELERRATTAITQRHAQETSRLGVLVRTPQVSGDPARLAQVQAQIAANQREIAAVDAHRPLCNDPAGTTQVQHLVNLEARLAQIRTDHDRQEAAKRAKEVEQGNHIRLQRTNNHAMAGLYLVVAALGLKRDAAIAAVITEAMTDMGNHTAVPQYTEYMEARALLARRDMELTVAKAEKEQYTTTLKDRLFKEAAVNSPINESLVSVNNEITRLQNVDPNVADLEDARQNLIRENANVANLKEEVQRLQTALNLQPAATYISRLSNFSTGNTQARITVVKEEVKRIKTEAAAAGSQLHLAKEAVVDADRIYAATEAELSAFDAATQPQFEHASERAEKAKDTVISSGKLFDQEELDVVTTTFQCHRHLSEQREHLKRAIAARDTLTVA